ncbi:MAG: response regulator [Candidatus Hydrogenedentota bacterium]
MIRSILIADDEEPNRVVLCETFARKGYRVVAVSNGIEAIEYVRTRPTTLGILDHDMPGMGGLDVLREMRHSHVSIPILIVTSSTDQRLREKAIAEGAQGFFSKPVDVGRIRAAVADLIGEETSIVVRTIGTEITVTFSSNRSNGAGEGPHGPTPRRRR